jgi:hypothetical protein
MLWTIWSQYAGVWISTGLYFICVYGQKYLEGFLDTASENDGEDKLDRSCKK